jgi:replicative DNA helicase
VAVISRRLKWLSKELRVPVVTTARLGRGNDDRSDHRPRLSDLRQNWAVEQEADTVLMLHRPELYEPERHEGIVELIIAKQRNGPTAEVTLTFLKQFMRFEDFHADNPFQS